MSATSNLPADILAFARDMRDAFGSGVRLKFAATDDGEIFGNPAYDDPGAPKSANRASQEVL